MNRRKLKMIIIIIIIIIREDLVTKEREGKKEN
jgi:hypothetical protein